MSSSFRIIIRDTKSNKVRNVKKEKFNRILKQYSIYWQMTGDI